MDRPHLFVSAVTKELGNARRKVAATLRSLGYDPVSEDDFSTGQGELRRWLCQQIDESEGLIQLVGESYGAEPPDIDSEYGRVSYTQLEFLCTPADRARRPVSSSLGKITPATTH